MPAMTPFHDSGCRRPKHFCPDGACKHTRRLFAEAAAHGRFVETGKETAARPAPPAKKARPGKCAGDGLADGTPRARGRRRAHARKAFEGTARRAKCSTGSRPATRGHGGRKLFGGMPIDGMRLAAGPRGNMKGAPTSVSDSLLPGKRAVAGAADGERKGAAQALRHFRREPVRGRCRISRFPKEPRANARRAFDTRPASS